MNKLKTFPYFGRAGEALPADAENALVCRAWHVGHDYASGLLEHVHVFAEAPDISEEARHAAARAVLEGFVVPLLPLIADALALLGDDARTGLVSGLLDDLAHGAAHALDLMSDERGTHGR